MTCCSIEYVRGYGFWSFVRNLFDRYGKKLLGTAIETGLDAANIAYKKVILKTAEATG